MTKPPQKYLGLLRYYIGIILYEICYFQCLNLGELRSPFFSRYSAPPLFYLLGKEETQRPTTFSINNSF